MGEGGSRFRNWKREKKKEKREVKFTKSENKIKENLKRKLSFPNGRYAVTILRIGAA